MRIFTTLISIALINTINLASDLQLRFFLVSTVYPYLHVLVLPGLVTVLLQQHVGITGQVPI